MSEVPGFCEREAVAELGGLANCTFVISEDGGDVLAGRKVKVELVSAHITLWVRLESELTLHCRLWCDCERHCGLRMVDLYVTICPVQRQMPVAIYKYTFRSTPTKDEDACRNHKQDYKNSCTDRDARDGRSTKG